MKNTLVKHTKTQGTQMHARLWDTNTQGIICTCFSKLTLVRWRPQLFLSPFLVDFMGLNCFPDGSGLSIGVSRVCSVWGKDSKLLGLLPEGGSRWGSWTLLQLPVVLCWAGLKVLQVHDIFPQPLHARGGAGVAFSFALLKSVIIYLLGLGCFQEQVGCLPPFSLMFCLVSAM